MEVKGHSTEKANREASVTQIPVGIRTKDKPAGQPNSVSVIATPTTTLPLPITEASGSVSPPLVWIDRNALLHLTNIGIGLTVALVTGQWWWFFVVPFAVLVLTEFLYFRYAIPIYSHANRVRRAYEWFDTYLDGAWGQGRDLTEAYFDGDTTIPYDQALEKKFEKFIELLGLEPGDSLLDVGCGYGDFIKHLNQRGIKAQGLTLSEHQAKVCKERGLDVICADAKQMPEELFHQFDAVTFMGCLEHFGTYVTHWDRSEHDALLERTFESAHKLLKPTSRVRRILTSTIHEIKLEPRGVDWIHGYLVERHYSGLYPLGHDGLVKNSRKWFDQVYSRDASDDYRLASELDPVHFGNFKVRWTPKRVLFVPLLAFLDPFWLHKWLYHVLGSWMWQFGGIGGLPRSERPVTLWWFVLQAKDVEQVEQ